MRAAVVDTSIVFKWYHHESEDDVAAALTIRDAFLGGSLALAAPDLLVYELVNTFRFKKKLTAEETVDAIRSFWAMGLDIQPVNAELSESMYSISNQCRISVYDAAFVALSQRTAAPLLTADRVLHKKVAARHAVMLLADVVR